MMTRLGIIAFLLAMFTCEAHQQSRIPLSDYFFETWNTRSGLPHNSINSLAQTHDGYLWIATWEGLARFNGQEFKLFTRAEINNLPDSGLRTLSVTQEGGLLIAGARGGISLYQYQQWNTQPSAATMVNHIIQSRKGGLWLALENDGVFYRAPNSHKDTPIIKNVSAYRVLEDGSGVIWAATSDGLYKITEQQATLITTAQGLPSGPVYNLLLSRENKLIVSSENGASVLTGKHFTALHPQLRNEAISSMLEDSQGDLWFGTINKGIFRLSDNTLEQLDEKDGLPANRILSLLQDSEHSIWVGTNAGLFRLRAAPFSSWTKKRGLSGDYVRTVMSHSDGSLWVGGSTGLDRFNNAEITTIANATTGTPYSVLSLLEGDNGDVWVGTYTSGVLKVSNNHITPFLNRGSGLGSNEVRSLLLDAKRRLWIGSAMGLTRVEQDGTLVQFTNKKELPSGFILALAEDSRGNVWIGTGNGVVVFDNATEQFTAVTFPAQFAAQYAFGFYIEQDYTWMATDRGLVRYQHSNGAMAMLGREHGLPVDKLFQVLHAGNAFWLTSNRGIIQVDRTDVNNILDANQPQPLLYQLYDEGDGMLSAQANGGSTPSATVHSNGTLWFATAKGVSTVNPHRLHETNQLALPTIIENFVVDGSPTALPLDNETVLLPPGVSRLSFQYAGLSFIMPQRLRFQTQLKGFNQGWVDRQQINMAEYTNLPAGEYTFMVRAGYPNGQWQQNEKVIHFVIQAHYWQKFSFKLMVFLSFLLLIYALYKYRLYHYKKVEAQLMERVEQQTHALQQQANAFSYQATHDQLTGLPNRRAFDSWLGEHFATYKAQNKPLAMAIMDIDHFKRINDSWSHMVGDKVICKIADILNMHCAGEQKTARWGGEEFTLVFPNQTAAQAQLICEQLRLAIANNDYSNIADNLQDITASFGIADSIDVADHDRLLARADQALYTAKNTGRNRIVVI
ncbi:two-component regulator propeller domain-containing protein [Pseudoalteromonas sp.]|uniref:ligand-binding sensor domain-containing diguanylate cyclase n=1 Tax=Pseudoalteromonas sp. TaxID=53249 RepID=UPI00356B28C9